MLVTTPDQIRSGLAVITREAQADVRAVVRRAGGDPAEARSALFAATPLIVGEYAEGAAALALDWYEEVRATAAAPTSFAPAPFAVVDDEDIAAMVAVSTEPLYQVERGLRVALDEAVAESVRFLEQNVQRDVAAGFRDTIVGNTRRDPDATGWRRFARPGACAFCLMLADRGAVYTEATADFAAHKSCHCVAGPAYDPKAPRASAMQYLGSKRERTPEERARLRDYLNKHYPDAPG